MKMIFFKVIVLLFLSVNLGYTQGGGGPGGETPITIEVGTSDDGIGIESLRDAIIAVNNYEADIITFQGNLVAGDGSKRTLILTSELPNLTRDSVEIYFSNSSLSNYRPFIIDGSNLGNTDGLTILASNINISDLEFRNFIGNGLKLGDGMTTYSNINISECTFKSNLIGINAQKIDTLILNDNFIGTNINDNNDFGNTNQGVLIAACKTDFSNNLIAFNQYGIESSDSLYLSSGNSFFCNTDKGIYLNTNNPKTVPIITNIIYSFRGTSNFLNRIEGKAEPNDQIDLYLQDTDNCANTPCQGKTFLNSTTADDSGNWSTSYSSDFFPIFTATATKNGQTSEFSNCAKAINDFCEFADTLRYNPKEDICGNIISTAILNYAENSNLNNASPCADTTYVGNDVWFQFTPPPTGNFLLSFDPATTILPAFEIYEGTCGNLQLDTCYAIDSLNVFTVFENYQNPIFIRLWDQNNAIIESGGTAKVVLKAGEYETRADWLLCEGDMTRSNSQLIVQHIGEVGDIEVQQAIDSLKTILGFEPQKSCSCGNNLIQLWQENINVDIETTRKTARKKTNVDTMNYNLFIEEVEFELNTYSTGNQRNTQIAMNKESDLVAVWADTDGGKIFGRLYNSAGNPIGEEITIFEDAVAVTPDVIMDDSSNFIVIWENLTDNSIQIKKFDNTANPIGDVVSIGSSNYSGTQPQLAIDNAGNYLVSYFDGEESGGKMDTIRIKKYAAQNDTLLNSLKIPIDDNQRKLFPKIAMNSTGNFGVIWHKWKSGITTITSQFYDNNFNQTGSFNTTQDFHGQSVFPNISVNDNNEFLLAWGRSQNNSDGGIYFQKLSQTGDLIGGQQHIQADFEISRVPHANAELFNDGSFIIVSDGYTNQAGIFIQQYNSDGIPKKSAEITNSSIPSAAPIIASNKEEFFAMLWEDKNSKTSIYAQRYELESDTSFFKLGTSTPSSLLGQQLPFSGAFTPNNPTDTVQIGVIDTGIDTSHIEVKNTLWKNTDASDDENCLVEDEIGYDFLNDEGTPEDIEGHGTQVNGVIIHDFPGEVQPELMNLKFYEGGRSSVFGAICAIYYAVDEGVDVLNLSWGFEANEEPTILKNALEYAQNHGVLIITTSGNTSKDNDQIKKYPANFDLANLIVVGSYQVDKEGNNPKLSAYSSFGKTTVDLAARGYVETLDKGNTKNPASGTSVAAPAVARTAAIIKGLYPNLTATEIKACILDNVTQTSTLMDKVATGGYLNHDDALNCAGTKSSQINNACSVSGLNVTLSITPEGCNEKDGAIQANSGGNDASPSFQWSTGSTNQNINALKSGNYLLTVTDDVGCTQVYEATVEDACIKGVCHTDLALNKLISNAIIYKSNNTIESTSIINTTEMVRYEAGESITLKPGFHVTEGSNFLATIQNCGSSFEKRIIPRSKNPTTEKVNSPVLKVYPNPFIEQTKLDIYLAEKNDLQVALYDLNGRRLKNIFQGNLKKGQHTFTLKATNLAAGIYLVQMRTKQNVIVQKIVLGKL